VDLENVRLCSLICIGHDEESALSRVPESAHHLRHAEILEFDPYGVDAMRDILEARVETGLEPGVIGDDQLTRIANEVAGSARYGVQSLRSAVELGQQRNHTSVQDEDIDAAFEHAKNRIRKQLLTSLSRQHHIVYQIIRDAGDGGIRPPEILEVYRDRVPDPRSRQQVTTYREKLERYDLIEGDDDASRWTRYTAVDDTLKTPLAEERTATVSDGP
jgi:cell division control protein 6